MICSRYFESNRSATLSIGIGCLIFSCLILILSSYGVSHYSDLGGQNGLPETGDNVTTTASTSAMSTTTPTTPTTTTTSRVSNMDQPTTPTTTTTKTPLPTTAVNGTTPPVAKPVDVEYEDGSSTNDSSSISARNKRDDRNQTSIENTVGTGATSNSTASEAETKVTRNLLSCTVVLSIVNIVASILLIVGTVQEKKDFLLGWMIVTIFSIVYLASSLITFFVCVAPVSPATVTALISVLGICSIVAFSMMWTVVRSHYIVLGGTERILPSLVKFESKP